MIGGYSDHAANERTYLAWVRTGIAVIAFGFVIEKFNFFLLTIASVALKEPVHQALLSHLSERVGRYDGLALIFGGIAIVILATARFIRTTRLLDDARPHSASSARAELVLSGCLVLLIATYSLYLAFA